jgi:MoaA/NifB/PqqE/SkfB family radical SAM enzyme
MFKMNLANLVLSKVNINRVKGLCAGIPILNTLFKIGSQRLIDYNYPVHVFIETTRVCNLRCKSCPSSMLFSNIGHMDFGLFKKIVDEATDFGAKGFCLHMLGEPLLYPRISEAVKYIKDSNPHHSILLTTNGYFLDAQKARMLLENNVDKIAVSFFSLREERANMLTGGRDIQGVIDNVRFIASLKRQLNSSTKIYIRMLICDENEDELENFRMLSRDVGVLLEIVRTHNYSGIIKHNYTSKFKLKQRYPCYHLWFSPAITWDGKAVICCNDANYTEVLGDLRNGPLSEIWQGERIRELRNYHLKGEYNKIPLCNSCNVWAKYPDIFFRIQKR